MGSGPVTGRRERATLLRAALPCLAAIIIATPVRAQTLTPDMLRPVPGGFLAPQDSLLRKTGDNAPPQPPDPNADVRAKKDQPAPPRIGTIPKYGLPAANGASDAGFDSLNRVRKKPKLYPGQAKPKPLCIAGGTPPVKGMKNTFDLRRADNLAHIFYLGNNIVVFKFQV